MNVDASTPTTTDTANWPIFSGWPFHAWIQHEAERINQAARFLGAAAIHNAYDRGGLAAAIERCNVGLAAANSLAQEAADRGDVDGANYHAQFWLGWWRVLIALARLREQRQRGQIDAYNRPVVTA